MPKVRKERRRLPPLWKPDDGITVSMLNTWLRCRHQCLLKYLEGWTKRGVNIPIEFGNVFHNCLECLEGVPTPEQINKQIAKYSRSVSKLYVTADEREDFKHCCRLAASVLPHYFKFYQRDKIKWKSRETVFRVKHTVPDHGNIVLTGKRDGEFLSQKKLWLFETKTKGQVDEHGLQESLKFNLQTMYYLLAMRYEENEEPEGVKYNVIKRPGHRQGRSESSSDFYERVSKEVSKAPDAFFHRWTITLDDGEIDEWVDKQLNPILDGFLNWYESVTEDHWDEPMNSPLHYVNPESLFGAYGQPVDMFHMMTKGITVGYFRRDTAHQELVV